MFTNDADETTIAVVSGSAQGLGRRVCEELVGWGCTVFGLDIQDHAVLTGPGELRPVRCDVTDAEDVAAACRLVSKQRGVPRIIVANAGRYPNRPLESWTLTEFEELWRLNVGGAFNVVQQFLPLLRAAEWSRVVVVSSNAALMGVPGFVPYAATKAALLGMTRALAAEVAADGVTVNAIAPGLTRTETAATSDVAPFFEQVREGQLVRRSMQPEDLVPALRYLCDPRNGMVTGQTLVVDGGVVLH